MMENKEKRKIFNYDEYSDSLLISERGENERIKENFILGDFIISFNEKGKISGLEIRDVSNLFHDYGYDSSILNNILSCELIVEIRRDFVFIGFKIIAEINSELIEKKIPLGYFPRQITLTH